MGLRCMLQEKKKAEEDRAKELNELFAVAIKQPKVPVGEPSSTPSPYIIQLMCRVSHM